MEKVMYYYHHKVYMGDRLAHDYFECPCCGLIADKDERPTWLYCPCCGINMEEMNDKRRSNKRTENKKL